MLHHAAPCKPHEQSGIWKTLSPVAIKRVTARGRRYVYIRGTDIVLVRGFIGADDQLDGEIARALADRGMYVAGKSSKLIGWRLDAAKALHKRTSSRARRKGRSYSLSVDAIVAMLTEARDRCVVTGLAFDYRDNANPDWRTNPMAPSLTAFAIATAMTPGTSGWYAHASTTPSTNLASIPSIRCAGPLSQKTT